MPQEGYFGMGSTLIQTTAFEVLLPECGEILTALLVYME